MEETKPIVTVVIATYNREDTLPRAIASVLAQTYSNLEVIVVDDGSTDNTKSVVEPFLKDQRVRYVYQKNQGSNVYSMNRGISEAKGKYIAILDDDDFWSNQEKIAKQAGFLESHPDYVLVGGGAVKTAEGGKEIVTYLMPETDEEIRRKILVSSMFVHISVLYRRDAFLKAGGYDKQFGGAADWDMWMKLGTSGKFYNIPEVLVSYTAHRVDNPSYVERAHGKIEWLKINLLLKKKHSKNYPNYARALLFCWLGFFYSLLPFRRQLWATMFKVRSWLSGDYKYDGKKS